MSSPLNSPLLNFRNAVFRAESALFHARGEGLSLLSSLGADDMAKRKKVIAMRARVIKMQEEADKLRLQLDKMLDAK